MTAFAESRFIERTGADSGGPRDLEPGSSTAVGMNVEYRLRKLSERGLLRGDWLDCGCADGGYAVAMAALGADAVVGIDIEEDRIAQARERSPQQPVSFHCASADALPFPEAAFDGVFMNEVLEHVRDEVGTLREIRRVLRPGGHLVLISPNRWFPFEGHGLRIKGPRTVDVPVPLVPWLPARLTSPFLRARNYWPHELRSLVRAAGLDVVATSSVFPVFEVFPWLPARVIRWYRRALPTLEKLPLVRRFGVSTLVVARKS